VGGGLGGGVGSGAGGSAGGGSAAGGGGGSAALVLGDKYLFFAEAGGLGWAGSKPVCDSIDSFGGWRQLLAPTELDAAKTWPADLTPYRVIAISFLGSAPMSTGLSAAERDALVTWVRAGGTVLFLTDLSYDASSSAANTTTNATLSALGIDVVVDGRTFVYSGYALPLSPANPISAGVEPLACGAATYLVATPPATLVDASSPDAGQGVLAEQDLGRGRVLVLSDASCVADDDYATGTPPVYADCALGDFATASLGTFLKNLALP
jgi:hypothetical protein